MMVMIGDDDGDDENNSDLNNLNENSLKEQGKSNNQIMGSIN